MGSSGAEQRRPLEEDRDRHRDGQREERHILISNGPSFRPTEAVKKADSERCVGLQPGTPQKNGT